MENIFKGFQSPSQTLRAVSSAERYTVCVVVCTSASTTPLHLVVPSILPYSSPTPIPKPFCVVKRYMSEFSFSINLYSVFSLDSLFVTSRLYKA